MHVHDRLELLVGHLLDDAVPGVAGVVDDDVETTEAVERRGHEAVAEVRRGDIARAHRRFATSRANLLSDFECGRLVEIVHDDARAFARQLQRDRAADAAARAGDDRDFAL